MIKAVIFDMDGTTVDSIHSIAYYANNALKKYGYFEVETDKFYTFVGDGPRKLFERLLNNVGGDQSKIDEILNYYLTQYNKNSLYLAKPYDGIIKMLEDLKNKGIKTAIVSNKQDEAVKVISRELFGNLIDVTVGFKPDVPRKPAPDSLLNIMKELKVKKEEVLFVGDTNVDIFTAKNADVLSIGVLWGFRDEQELKDAGADYIVSSAEEIAKIAL